MISLASSVRRWLPRVAAVCVFLHGAATFAAPPEISPPFGLQWGENDVHIDELLKGAKATITDKHEVEGREAWTVEGLLQVGLKRAIFYFQQNQLVEVELQYQNDAWDVAKYDEFMRQVRSKVEERYGPGQLIARSKGPADTIKDTDKKAPDKTADPDADQSADKAGDQDADSGSKKAKASPSPSASPSATPATTPDETGVTQTVVGYKWEENNTAIELFYFSAEKGDESFRTVSVHYRME
ncbi:MAG: hypothetical protein QM796_09550 [Chthoniobacteraceae bacterium]